MIRRMMASLFSKFKYKLIIFTALIMVFVIALIEIFIYIVAIPGEMNHAIDNNMQEVQRISERVDETVAVYNLLANVLTMDIEVQDYLKKGYSSRLEELTLNFELEKNINSRNIISADKFVNVFIYDMTKLRYKFSVSAEDSPFLELNQAIYNPEGGIEWRVENGTVYIHRSIRDRSSLKIIGYMTMVIENKYLKNRIQTTTARHTYVFNESEHLVVENTLNKDIDSAIILDKSKNIKGRYTIVLMEPNKDQMLLTAYRSKSSLWRISSIVSLKDITSETRSIGIRIIEIGLAGILIGILFVWFSTALLIHPLKDLTFVMNQIEKDVFDLRVRIRGKDEFGLLGRSFNRMMEKINYLISEVYKKEISQKEAEYKALVAQINPHFIYNTLETIRLLSSFGETSKVEEATVALAKLLKSNITTNSNKFNTVREELSNINAYLTIQSMRFQDKIVVSVNVDESLLNDVLPQFILQPIIENAYIHGLEHKVEDGNLFLNGFSDKFGMKFQVIDNGVGMSEETLKELLNEDKPESASSEKSGSGTGVMNVHKRIRLMFGEPFGLTIQSSPSVGTIIEILLPRRQ
jgi:two-component system sensor histidine kinase YesM